MGIFYSQLIFTPTFPSSTSFKGQTVIVTGSNVGLGKEAARHIAALGASKLILAVRNTKAGEEAKTDIETTTKVSSDVIEVWSLDLSSYKSVRSFAHRASNLPRLDILLENAAIATTTWELAEGHERTITVNVITKEFSVKPRLVIVSSGVHGMTKFPERDEPQIFDFLDDEKSKSRMPDRYNISKLLEVLTVRQIAPRLEGSGVILNMLNPGLCHSELARNSGWGLAILKFFFARTTEVGSRTLIAAAAAGPESHGQYMNDAAVSQAALSNFVKSEDGKEASNKVWKELSTILEKIQPGVTGNLG